MLFRCLAKIAFNYTAWAGGADFVLHDSFDATRAFIRYGTRPTYPVVIPRATPIPAEDTPA